MSLEARKTSAVSRVQRSVRSRIPLSRAPQPSQDRMSPTWRQAKPRRIAAALAVSQEQNSGGWFVAGASADVPAATSITRTIAGREIVFWRDTDGTLVAGPGACPHLGALLDKCAVADGTLLCFEGRSRDMGFRRSAG